MTQKGRGPTSSRHMCTRDSATHVYRHPYYPLRMVTIHRAGKIDPANERRNQESVGLKIKQTNEDSGLTIESCIITELDNIHSILNKTAWLNNHRRLHVRQALHHSEHPPRAALDGLRTVVFVCGDTSDWSGKLSDTVRKSFPLEPQLKISRTRVPALTCFDVLECAGTNSGCWECASLRNLPVHPD